ncbi:helix-turn-helix transcriptional regulator [Geothrix sp. 21YS21S-4]|uniref:helix-turn-helix transcriptional regulator n=1 Tax=Geothrix sp. 21YS21S-4 TaxID=3068889 RepID=UPI0027BA1705|nr:helix-turn-helix transcriptional regulator [Geothrix sp. 21YS21S-4]
MNSPGTGFPRRLREVRESLGFGQQAFADLLEVSQQTVSLWERGRRVPGRRMWSLIERKLGYSRESLETGTGFTLPDPGVAERPLAGLTVPLPVPREGVAVTRVGLTGLAAEALDLGPAQRALREAVRKGRPVWLVVG